MTIGNSSARSAAEQREVQRGQANAQLVQSKTPTTESPTAKLHVAPNLPVLVRSAANPAQPQLPQTDHRDLDALVHRVLLAGLIASVALVLIGLGLDLVLWRPLPERAPTLGEILPRLLAGRPSGVLTLGLLLLIATPVLRVVGSIVAFVIERDWRYAAVTSLVLLVLLLSIALGHG